MSIPDLNTVAQVLRDAADSEILPRFRQLAAADIREKGPGDLVTVADEAAEIAITPRLLALLPGSIVVGEEAAAADPELLRHLSGDQAVWVIDPIDGTANYASGVPVFAVMVALIRHDKTIASWIYDPISGDMAMAKAGSGVSVAGDALAPKAEAGRRGVLSTNFYGRPELRRQIEARRSTVDQQKSLRCAGHEYLRLARGDLDFLLYSKLMPWDHAPGILMVQELGGQADYIEGGHYRPSRAEGPSGLLIARNKQIWDDVHHRLFGPN
jgi:fructose-1,6-bisphosphatase/inositol monophosphatase family enzyme